MRTRDDDKDLLDEQIPDFARRLTGQALVDYVNEHQTFFKAEYTPNSGRILKYRLMDLKYVAKPKKEEILKIEDFDEELPDSFDAREKWPECTSIGYIRDQSDCGSDWAVASAEVMSDRICIQSNGTRKILVSDADIFACCGIRCGVGCVGGSPIQAFRYVERVGACTGGRYREKNVCKPYPFYPCGQHQNQTYYGPCVEGNYTFNVPKCRKMCQLKYLVPYEKDKIYGDTSYFLPKNEKLIRYEILKKGPVVAQFTVHEDFIHYKKGIYKHKAGGAVALHVAKVIGWGTENGTDYWLLANSYNVDWGENGETILGLHFLNLSQSLQFYKRRGSILAMQTILKEVKEMICYLNTTVPVAACPQWLRFQWNSAVI
ncbi:papain family cysteine protease [Necator americanus]|uniref:Papain family cysteine protease n=1 Tax=Necator americanus TaxID=51031 RepID=W2SQD9_NECAM|nr:papain family cysteine protease [Necator americanus]ETN71096.1 papain family cysteine protease [Necator americanus]